MGKKIVGKNINSVFKYFFTPNIVTCFPHFFAPYFFASNIVLSLFA